MARLIYSARAFSDLEPLTDFLLESDPGEAERTIGLVMGAVETLRDHPLIGRPAEDDLRELMISRGRTGYVALYSFERVHETVVILAIRHQREAGYSGDAP